MIPSWDCDESSANKSCSMAFNAACRTLDICWSSGLSFSVIINASGTSNLDHIDFIHLYSIDCQRSQSMLDHNLYVRVYPENIAKHGQTNKEDLWIYEADWTNRYFSERFVSTGIWHNMTVNCGHGRKHKQSCPMVTRFDAAEICSGGRSFCDHDVLGLG